ncbi:DUF4041 domain-containing protein [Ligilactobacillus agilis]|uniref:DUF4041 domain-containing protein n=1 Tax=Ligilactobacillus agilis TaxID=1601 RepID=UPI001437B41B|nr:DUF4041 domain-containing protein [Ligilactobacillus agilis]MBL1056993.1 DUF4041 domain-containing protein [Ligilactobacillus agilis]GET16406.1 chromosome segregation ATPase [Ligilactobacillus agilis]
MVITFIIICLLIWLLASIINKKEREKDKKEQLNLLEIREESLNQAKEELNYKEQDYEKRNSDLTKREQDFFKIEATKDGLETIITTLNQEIESLKKDIKSLKKEAKIASKNNLIVTSTSLIDLNISDETTSSEVKNQLALLKKENANLVKNHSVKISSHIESAKERNKLARKVLLSFNSEVAGLLNKLTFANIDSTRNKITNTFERINKLYEDDEVQITTDYLKYQLSVLELNYQFILKKHNEKEQQAAIKEQMLDEAKAQKELEKEQKRILSEQRKFDNELSKTMKYLSNSTDSVQSEIYAEKIRELEAKIKQLESDKEDVDNRLLNTRAGYVYVISNIGSFGENIYKIGMTKRLNPLDRVNELGSASVPFKFDVHAMIFSDDAPTLENHLHKVFADKSVNKINPRKEFFNVSLKDIEKEVLEHFDATVEFTEFAKAEEYRRSLELATEV